MASYYTAEDDLYLRENYHHEEKATILKNLNRSWPSIKDRSKRLGLSRPNIRTSQLKHLLGDTIINGYWWGLIYSDGHITDNYILKVKLQETDKQYLDGLAEYLGCKSRPEGNMIVIEAMDKINGEILKNKLRLNKRKTYNPPYSLDFIKDDKILLALLIGMIDGDGYISRKNGSFKCIKIEVHESWIHILSELSTRLNSSFGFKSNTRVTSRDTALFYLGRKESYETLCNFIQENKIPILNRKWNLNEESN